MTFQFRPARLEGAQVLLGLAGPSSSGKTLSALLLAKGLSGGKPFAFIDTESGRALHYANRFDFLHAELTEPYTPASYGQAIADAAKHDPPVIVIDSMSHEHSGIGGVLDMHEAELERLAGTDAKRRDAMNMTAWKKPKQERKRLISQMLQLRCHLILCFRAEEKVDIVPDPAKPGKTKIVPKRLLTGHVGWIPVCGKEYPYELTASFVVTPDHPGVPKIIKVMDDHADFFPAGQPITEKAGEQLARWASGAVAEPEGGEGGAGEARRSTGTGSGQVAEAREADTASRVDRRETESSSHPSGSATAARRDLKAWLKENNVPGEQARSVSAELFPGVAAGDLDAVQVARVRERLEELLVGAEA